jgi:hypothetical protein
MSSPNPTANNHDQFEAGKADGEHGRLLRSTHPSYWHGWCRGVKLRHWFINTFLKRKL